MRRKYRIKLLYLHLLLLFFRALISMINIEKHVFIAICHVRKKFKEVYYKRNSPNFRKFHKL